MGTADRRQHVISLTWEQLHHLRAMLPKAHIAAVYAKERGMAHIDSFVVTAPQNAWLLFHWNSQLRLPPKKTA
ncbi:MAG: hypothetical protein LBI88_04985 [Deltaproteobacteria bacterium]|jgi:hypothetical protein|nr:hypothetical protein [Deltaproteobacteria bacterium]